MEIVKKDLGFISQNYQNWQNRPEWFFNREHTDTYEQWYEGRYKRAEVWQKKVMEQLVSKDQRIKTLLEFGCGTTCVQDHQLQIRHLRDDVFQRRGIHRRGCLGDGAGASLSRPLCPGRSVKLHAATLRARSSPSGR